MRSLASRIRSSERLLGLLVRMPAPATVELAGYSGFDFVLLDTEHGERVDLEHHLRAAGSVGLECLVRVGGRDDVEILRALDAGAAGVVVPHISNIAQAEAIVAAAHYPPLGRRGLSGTTRGGRYGTMPLREYVAAALESTVVVGEFEEREALDQISQIADCPNLDALFLGRIDLSASLGHPGDLEHPELVAAAEKVAEGVLAAGNAALCVLAESVVEAREWEKRGARMIVFAAAAIQARGLGEIVEQVRDRN